MTAEAELNGFIDRYPPEVARDGRFALAFLTARLPTAIRLVYDNYNALVIGFGASPKVSDICLSIAFYPRYVTLFFLKGAQLPDPSGLLEGKGSSVRGIKLRPVSKIQSTKVGALIEAALANLSTPLPSTGEGPLIIKSISARQRPRRPKS